VGSVASHGSANHGSANHGSASDGTVEAGALDAKETGERVEALLAELRARSGPEAGEVAEELVTCLVRLYGAGLETIMRTIGTEANSTGQRLKALLIADPLVESLLLVHDLHPLDTDTRIRRALGRLGVGAELLGIDEAGVVEVKLGKGCGSMTTDIEQAVTDAAPEITGVRFAPKEATLLQITHRPAGAR
jgi:hypothetical protein